MWAASCPGLTRKPNVWRRDRTAHSGVDLARSKWRVGFGRRCRASVATCGQDCGPAERHENKGMGELGWHHRPRGAAREVLQCLESGVQSVSRRTETEDVAKLVAHARAPLVPKVLPHRNYSGGGHVDRESLGGKEQSPNMFAKHCQDERDQPVQREIDVQCDHFEPLETCWLS